MGMWHAVEIIQHRDEQRYRGVMTTDTCPRVHLSNIGSNDLKMMWQEPAGYVEYRFRMTDPANPGFWLSWGPQNGKHVFIINIILLKNQRIKNDKITKNRQIIKL